MLKKIRNSNFYKITFGSVLAQIVIVLVSPLTTRIYSPEQLGNYTLIISIVSLVLPVINLKFDTLIVTDNNKKILAVYTSFFLGIFVSILTFIFSLFYLKTPNTLIWSLLLLIILLLNSVNNIGISLSNSDENYQLIGNFNLIKSLIQNFLLVFLGIFKMDVTGMLLSQLLGSSSGTYKMFKESNFKFSKNDVPKLTTIKAFIKKNMGLITYSAPAHFINSLSYNILNFFINGLFGASIFGFYSLAFRILGMPLTVVSQNFSKIFFKEASDEWNSEGRFSRSLKKHTLILAFVALLFLIGAIFLSPLAFKIIFGSAWETTGNYVQILAPMFAIRLVVSSLTPAFLIARKQNAELAFQSAFLFLAVVCYFISIKLETDIVIFLISISISYVLVYLFG